MAKGYPRSPHMSMNFSGDRQILKPEGGVPHCYDTSAHSGEYHRGGMGRAVGSVTDHAQPKYTTAMQGEGAGRIKSPGPTGTTIYRTSGTRAHHHPDVTGKHTFKTRGNPLRSNGGHRIGSKSK